MALFSGTRVGPYEIVSVLGAGGMGEVYRARDTALNRDVALKVLPESFAADPDRLARFQREAQLLASLNHPHIAHLHGFEQSGPLRALVMELVEGEDLSQRIARGPIPLDEALPIAKQVADALEAAHCQGIVHRDLKPANVKVRTDGTVKVLDFGLAKAIEPAGSASHVSYAATITTPAMLTGAGMILGTAAYMSPEQARGKTVDKRADIWAFAVMLFEMLTGSRAFDGDEITDVIAAVVRAEPDWTRLPVDTPPAIRRVLRRSLRKDPKQRLADMADVRLELDDAATEAAAGDLTASVTPSPRPVWRERVWIGIAAASLLAAAAIAVRAFRAPQPDSRIVRFEIATPRRGTLDIGQPLSPDGRTVAFLSTIDGKSLIWVRPLDSGSARSLAGTESATRPFWSPDSQHIAFFSSGNLKQVAVSGAPAKLIATGPFRDGAWGTTGVILVGGQRGRPLFRVSELGGEPVAETTLDGSLGEISHDYPEFLPDGRHYIYLARGGGRSDEWTTYVGTLGAKDRRPLRGIRAAVKYSPSGHLLFLRDGTLMAQPFDRDRLELSGDAFPIAEQVLGGRTSTFSISQNGSLAFLGGSFESQLTWFDRTGRQLGVVGTAGFYQNPVLSRDGRFVAFGRGSPSDVWVLDVERSAVTKMTSDRGSDGMPVWSPDGQRFAFVSNRGGKQAIYEHNVSLIGDDRMLASSDVPLTLSDWSRDGKYLAYSAGDDVLALPLFGDARQPVPVTASPFVQDQSATFSPDGRWIAYQSQQSSGITRAGEGDVFVQSFPQRSFTRQVSTTGGLAPQWSDDGTELFYLTPDGTFMVVGVQPRASGLDIGAARPLFQHRVIRGTAPRYSVSRDGRFLVNLMESELAITVILNWFQQLQRGPVIP